MAHCITSTWCTVSLVHGALCHCYIIYRVTTIRRTVTATGYTMSLLHGVLCHRYMAHCVTAKWHPVTTAIWGTVSCLTIEDTLASSTNAIDKQVLSMAVKSFVRCITNSLYLTHVTTAGLYVVYCVYVTVRPVFYILFFTRSIRSHSCDWPIAEVTYRMLWILCTTEDN